MPDPLVHRLRHPRLWCALHDRERPLQRRWGRWRLLRRLVPVWIRGVCLVRGLWRRRVRVVRGRLCLLGWWWWGWRLWTSACALLVSIRRRVLLRVARACLWRLLLQGRWLLGRAICVRHPTVGAPCLLVLLCRLLRRRQITSVGEYTAMGDHSHARPYPRGRPRPAEHRSSLPLPPRHRPPIPRPPLPRACTRYSRSPTSRAVSRE